MSNTLLGTPAVWVGSNLPYTTTPKMQVASNSRLRICFIGLLLYYNNYDILNIILKIIEYS